MSETVFTKVVNCPTCKMLGFIVVQSVLSSGDVISVAYCPGCEILFYSNFKIGDAMHAIKDARDNNNNTVEDVLPTLYKTAKQVVLESEYVAEESTEEVEETPEVIDVEETPSRQAELDLIIDKQIYEDGAEPCSKCTSGKFKAREDHRKHDNGTMNAYWKDE